MPPYNSMDINVSYWTIKKVRRARFLDFAWSTSAAVGSDIERGIGFKFKSEFISKFNIVSR